MTDSDILYGLLNRLRAATNIEQPIKDEYERLVKNFPEHGFQQVLPLDAMSDEQEIAIRDLRKLGYVETSIEYHGSDGHFYHVDLRGEDFLKAEAIRALQNEKKMETFPTGARRDTDEDMPHPEYISPFATQRIAAVLAAGARKYGPYNYMKGLPMSRIMASLHRHLMKFQQRDTEEDHLAHLAANVMFLLHVDECRRRGTLPDSLDDLPVFTEIPQVHFNGD